MPKVKKNTAKKPPVKPRKRIYKKTSSKKSHLWLYVLIALGLFALVQWLIEPLRGPKDLSDSTKVVQKLKKHKLQKKVHQNILDSETEKEKPQQEKYDVEKGIEVALIKLGVWNNCIIKRKKNNTITYSVQIDPSIMELTFANMIIKGETVLNKGELLAGYEKKGRQYLTFIEPRTNKRFELELFYKRSEKPKLTMDKSIAIIVDDFGNINGELLKGFLNTNKAVTFAIIPDQPNSEITMQLAVEKGHECIIHIPMEPLNFPSDYPGDNAILVQMKPSEVIKRMEKFIESLPLCKGANNHMGSMATTDEQIMRTVIKCLKKHNMYFVDSKTTANSIAYDVGQRNLVPVFKRDIFLDEPDISAHNLDKKINECINMLSVKPYLVAIMHCHTKAHLDYLQNFISRIQANGIKLVSISELQAFRLPEIM